MGSLCVRGMVLRVEAHVLRMWGMTHGSLHAVGQEPHMHEHAVMLHGAALHARMV